MKKGFTLIELLVVIAIIGILSTIGVVSFNSARKKARDAKRESDVSSIATAVMSAYVDADEFPDMSSSSWDAFLSAIDVSGTITPPKSGDLYCYGRDASDSSIAYVYVNNIEGGKVPSDHYAGNLSLDGAVCSNGSHPTSFTCAGDNTNYCKKIEK